MTEVAITLTVVDSQGYLPDDLITWLGTHVGEVVNAHKCLAVGEGWHLDRVKSSEWSTYGQPETFFFQIADPNKALLFKLIWGGV